MYSLVMKAPLIFLLQTLILIVISYIVYLFPLRMSLQWALGISMSTHIDYLLTLGIAGCLIYYFKTKSKLLIFKRLVYAGVGPCYFATLITSLIMLVDLVIPIHDFLKLGTMLCLTTTLMIYAKFKGKQININYLLFSSSKITQSTTIVFLSDIHIGLNQQSIFKTL